MLFEVLHWKNNLLDLSFLAVLYYLIGYLSRRAKRRTAVDRTGQTAALRPADRTVKGKSPEAPLPGAHTDQAAIRHFVAAAMMGARLGKFLARAWKENTVLPGLTERLEELASACPPDAPAAFRIALSRFVTAELESLCICDRDKDFEALWKNITPSPEEEESRRGRQGRGRSFWAPRRRSTKETAPPPRGRLRRRDRTRIKPLPYRPARLPPCPTLPVPTRLKKK